MWAELHYGSARFAFAPAGLEKMFFEFGVPLEEGATEASPPTKEEFEKLMEIAPDYGIEVPGAGE